jgi:hypothetical protein
MDNIKNLALTVVAAGVVGGVLLWGAPAPVVQVVENGRVTPNLGAISGPIVPHFLDVNGALSWGAGTFATTSTGASTLAWADVDQVGSINRAGVALTMTLPASTTVTALPESGDCRNLYVENNGTGILTMAGGTGINLRGATSTAINPGKTAFQTWCRAADTDIDVIQVTTF